MSTNYSTTTTANDTDRDLGHVVENPALFIIWGILYVVIALVAAVGNGLVLYASYGNKNTGRLQYLDSIIKSLALTDMLYGLVGVPCRILNAYLLGWYIQIL